MWRVFLTILAVGATVTGVIGWFGISYHHTVGQGYCPQYYTHYAVTPFVRNWWECRRQQPCGVDENFNRYNAHVEVLQCLCQQQSANRVAISQYYIESFSREPLFHGKVNATVEGICATEARPIGRL